MLRKTNDVLGFTLAARDGELGRVKDFYFDDESWTVRYLVADTGKWLALRRVLISPFAVRGFHETDKSVAVDLTKDQVKHSPSIEADAPVSRQYELSYYQYYGWPYYWEGPGLWGPSARPLYQFEPALGAEPGPGTPVQRGDPHLRSTSEVAGYYLQAEDGDLGHVEDFVIDDGDWAIQYLVVDTRNWWPGKKVLVPPSWAAAVDWERSQVRVKLDRATIKNAPEYDTARPISREYEARLFDYYQRQPYWQRRMAA